VLEVETKGKLMTAKYFRMQDGFKKGQKRLKKAKKSKNVKDVTIFRVVTITI